MRLPLVASRLLIFEFSSASVRFSYSADERPTNLLGSSLALAAMNNDLPFRVRALGHLVAGCLAFIELRKVARQTTNLLVWLLHELLLSRSVGTQRGTVRTFLVS
jgi:hypothetical protein